MEHCIVGLRHLDTKKIGAEVFEKLRNVVLEENFEDKIVEKVTSEEAFESIGRRVKMQIELSICLKKMSSS